MSVVRELLNPAVVDLEEVCIAGGAESLRISASPRACAVLRSELVDLAAGGYQIALVKGVAGVERLDTGKLFVTVQAQVDVVDAELIPMLAQAS